MIAGGGGQGLASGRPDRRPAPAAPPRPGQAGGLTEDEGGLADADAARRVADREVVDAARAIAARLAVSRPREPRRGGRGSGELRSVPFGGGADEIDLDRTMDALAERRPMRPEDVVVRERRRLRRAVVLAVDVSGSMRGARIRTAAATVGALRAELGSDRLGVVAFWSDAAVLLRLGEHASLEQLVDELLAIEPVGLTNVAFPLSWAETELQNVGDARRRVILLSDCVHNAGPDPRDVAARLPRLDVLLDVSGEKDVELGRDLARAGRGTMQTVRTFRDVAPALDRILGRDAAGR